MTTKRAVALSAKKKADQKMALKAVYDVINGITTKDNPAEQLIEMGRALQVIGAAVKGLDLYAVERVVNAAAALIGIDD